MTELRDGVAPPPLSPAAEDGPDQPAVSPALEDLCRGFEKAPLVPLWTGPVPVR